MDVVNCIPTKPPHSAPVVEHSRDEADDVPFSLFATTKKQY